MFSFFLFLLDLTLLMSFSFCSFYSMSFNQNKSSGAHTDYGTYILAVAINLLMIFFLFIKTCKWSWCCLTGLLTLLNQDDDINALQVCNILVFSVSCLIYRYSYSVIYCMVFSISPLFYVCHILRLYCFIPLFNSTSFVLWNCWR
jgi:hypothetical protein